MPSVQQAMLMLADGGGGGGAGGYVTTTGNVGVGETSIPVFPTGSVPTGFNPGDTISIPLPGGGTLTTTVSSTSAGTIVIPSPGVPAGGVPGGTRVFWIFAPSTSMTAGTDGINIGFGIDPEFSPEFGSLSGTIAGAVVYGIAESTDTEIALSGILAQSTWTSITINGNTVNSAAADSFFTSASPDISAWIYTGVASFGLVDGQTYVVTVT